MPEDDDEDTNYSSNGNGNSSRYVRSHSAPLESNDSWIEHQGTTSAAQSSTARLRGTEPSRGNMSDTPLPNKKETHGARLRARSASRAAGEGGWGRVDVGRVDVHGFLRLADLLHQRVVESLLEGDDEEEEEDRGALVLAGYGDAGPGVAIGGGGGGEEEDGCGRRHEGDGRGRDDSFCWEIDGGETGSVDWGESGETAAAVIPGVRGKDGSDNGQGGLRTVCIDVGGLSGRDGDVGGGGGAAVAAVPRMQGWREWSATLGNMAKSAARGFVGRTWFSRTSQVGWWGVCAAVGA